MNPTENEDLLIGSPEPNGSHKWTLMGICSPLHINLGVLEIVKESLLELLFRVCRLMSVNLDVLDMKRFVNH